VIHSCCDGNITAVFNIISKGFFLRLICKQGSFICTNELTIEVRVGFWEFSQGSECVGRCEGCVGAVEITNAAKLKSLKGNEPKDFIQDSKYLPS